MANTTHSVPSDVTAQKLLDFVRKIVENNKQSKLTGCVVITLNFKNGGIGSCEQQIKTFVCLD